MSRFEKLRAKFRACRGPYPWSDFITLITAMGYEKTVAGKTGGSRRKFIHPSSGHIISCHEPHDGEMGRSLVRELQEKLKAEGLL